MKTTKQTKEDFAHKQHLFYLNMLYDKVIHNAWLEMLGAFYVFIFGVLVGLLL